MSEVQERDWDAEARRQGWDPDADIPEEKKVDAQTFVERGEQMQGHLKTKVEKLESQVSSLTATSTEFKQHHDKALAKERAKTEDAITELEALKSKAIDDGDGAGFVQAERQINDLRAEDEEKPQELEPYQKAWLSENNWYNTSQKLRIHADGIADGLIKKGYTGQAYLDQLTSDIKEAFPEEFKNPARNAAPSVEGGGADRVASDPKKRSFDALPKKDQVQCDKFVEQHKNSASPFTREQFVEQYDWDQPDAED